jgi:hypothetical protein
MTNITATNIKLKDTQFTNRWEALINFLTGLGYINEFEEITFSSNGGFCLDFELNKATDYWDFLLSLWAKTGIYGFIYIVKNESDPQRVFISHKNTNLKSKTIQEFNLNGIKFHLTSDVESSRKTLNSKEDQLVTLNCPFIRKLTPFKK